MNTKAPFGATLCALYAFASRLRIKQAYIPSLFLSLLEDNVLSKYFAVLLELNLLLNRLAVFARPIHLARVFIL